MKALLDAAVGHAESEGRTDVEEKDFEVVLKFYKERKKGKGKGKSRK